MKIVILPVLEKPIQSKLYKNGVFEVITSPYNAIKVNFAIC